MYKPEEDLNRFGYAPVHSDSSDDSDESEEAAGAEAGAAETGALEAALTAQEIANIHMIINAMEGEDNAVANPMHVVHVMETAHPELFRALSERIGIETLINCVVDMARTRSLSRRKKEQTMPEVGGTDAGLAYPMMNGVQLLKSPTKCGWQR